MFTAYKVETNLPVTIKQMDMDEQPAEYLIKDILAMRDSHDANITSYVESFLDKNDLWVVMEYVEGSSLKEIISAPANWMTPDQIAAVSREISISQGLQHLHTPGIIHRDVKSDNVLSLNGDIKLSSY